MTVNRFLGFPFKLLPIVFLLLTACSEPIKKEDPIFDKKVALISSFLVSFYYPNIITPGYFLTENLFTPLLMLFFINMAYTLFSTLNWIGSKQKTTPQY